MQPHVLVVDDDTDIRELVSVLLGRAGFKVTQAGDGAQGLELFYEINPDLLLLDVGMPVLDGWTVLSRIRETSNTPVVMLTARGSELEKVRGLKAGADDYITKPFGRQELQARVEAVLRRAPDSKPEQAAVYDDGMIKVDFPQRAVEVNGEPVQLTPLEFKLLAALIAHAGEVVGREELLQQVWGDTSSSSLGQVKLYVGYLRRKLGFEAEGSPLETVRGFGYRYRPPATGE